MYNVVVNLRVCTPIPFLCTREPLILAAKRITFEFQKKKICFGGFNIKYSPAGEHQLHRNMDAMSIIISLILVIFVGAGFFFATRKKNKIEPVIAGGKIDKNKSTASKKVNNNIFGLHGV